MPCEGCTVQFTVFRRKRCCSDCKRFFCSNCLVPPSPTREVVGPLCERCAVFAKRPLLRVDLLQLKPKDLIFYLQSKHISTAGCVEKDELVGLVINHIQQADQTHATSNSSNRFSNGNATRGVDSTTHSFDTLKQTCQNFFSNISDKVDSFAFEAKPTQNKPQSESSCRSTPSNATNSHISEQPRVSTRVIPTYASFQHRQTQPSTEELTSEQRSHPQSPIASSSSNVTSQMQTEFNHSNTSPSVRNNSIRIPRCSPVVSLESSSPLELAGTEASANLLAVEQDPSPYTVDSNRCDDRHLNGSASGCDCSDDEIINTFRARAVGSRSSDRQHSLQSSPSIENPAAGPSGSSNVLTPTSSVTKKSSPSLKIESYDESSESSFEELGAVGGTSDDSKTAADISVQTSEQWQFIEKASEKLSAANTDSGDGKGNVLENVGVGPLTVAVRSDQTQLQRSLQIAMRPKKVARRRSDGYLNRRRPRSDDDDSPTSPDHFRPLVNCSNARSLLEEDEADNEICDNGNNGREVEMGKDTVLLVHDNRLSCRRCGKNRTNIKKHVEKMRRHLENSQMPESDIKQELEDFLVYLENRTKSLDCSDSDATVASSLSGVRDGTNRQLPPVLYDENEGINVYAAPPSFNAAMTNSRFIILEDFDSLKELENLSVKQLKEVLMLNRVDYKGCCEKQELFDRVARLWKNLKSTPTVEKLQTDELCKICMDAPIECVILECGHMATCTNCGKVLSECPICRQYIVRVVRFFKA